MNQTIDLMASESMFTMSLEEITDPSSKEIEELKCRIDLLTEDRSRLRTSNEFLVRENRKLKLHYELITKILLETQDRCEKVFEENAAIKDKLRNKECILNRFRNLLSDSHPEENRLPRNSSSGRSVKRLRRPIVTVTPTGFSRSFCK